jgi:hypothetical protein
MSFHKKILLSFLIFHLVFTFSVLVFEYLLASSGAYDDYGVHFSLVVVFQIALMSALSVALVAIAYVSRIVWSRTRQRRQRATTS